jgi:DNA-binding PadR family transcriptional regulator
LAKLVHPAVLTILAGGPLHGYGIVERMAQMPVTGGTGPNPTGVYRVLRALEQEGCVTSTWDLSDRGPAKKSYRLTSVGRQCLDQWIETLEDYRRAIGKLLSEARRTAGGGPGERADRRRAKKCHGGRASCRGGHCPRDTK